MSLSSGNPFVSPTLYAAASGERIVRESVSVPMLSDRQLCGTDGTQVMPVLTTPVTTTARIVTFWIIPRTFFVKKTLCFLGKCI